MRKNIRMHYYEPVKKDITVNQLVKFMENLNGSCSFVLNISNETLYGILTKYNNNKYELLILSASRFRCYQYRSYGNTSKNALAYDVAIETASIDDDVLDKICELLPITEDDIYCLEKSDVKIIGKVGHFSSIAGVMLELNKYSTHYLRSKKQDITINKTPILANLDNKENTEKMEINKILKTAPTTVSRLKGWKDKCMAAITDDESWSIFRLDMMCKQEAYLFVKKNLDDEYSITIASIKTSEVRDLLNDIVIEIDDIDIDVFRELYNRLSKIPDFYLDGLIISIDDIDYATCAGVLLQLSKYITLYATNIGDDNLILNHNGRFYS